MLLTGATGFVGSHVAEALLRRGLEVVGASRRPDGERSRADMPFRHVDLAVPSTVDRALEGIDRAVYLVHGMRGHGDYVQLERRYAETFRDAAARAGLERIVYLGGMRPRGHLSRHLESRLRTGEILRSGTVPVVELQATMVVGAGSESFRIVRDLAARLPWMLLPKWLESVTEPVAVEDVAEAIAHATTMPLTSSVVLPAPGPDQLSARSILELTARALGHAPRMAGVPFVTPKLSSYWIRLVTRADPHLATELVEGLRTSIVAEGETIWDRMPGFERTSFEDTVRRALAEEGRGLPPATRAVEHVIHQLVRGSRPHTP